MFVMSYLYALQGNKTYSLSLSFIVIVIVIVWHELICTREFRYVYLFSSVYMRRQWLKIDKCIKKIRVTNRAS